MSKCDFDGFDYYELIECWQIYIIDVFDDKHYDSFKNDNLLFSYESYILELFIENYIFAKIYGCNRKSKFVKKALIDMRNFIQKMLDNYKDISYWHPIWRGLLEIEDDFTFLQAFMCLVGHLWV